MREKLYNCPHCGKELDGFTAFNGICPGCHKGFDVANLNPKPVAPIYEPPKQPAKSTYVFLYRGDHGDYTVLFSRQGNNLTARCNCRAGECGQYCKHRFAIIRGETERILSNNKDEVAAIVDLVVGTDVETEITEVLKSEELYESARKEFIKKKKKVAEAMNN